MPQPQYLNHHRIKWAVMIGLIIWSVTLSGCSGGSNATCNAQVRSSPDTVFNSLFTRFSDGWTGGGNVHSLRLPDDRVIWFSGQTYLGMVNADRSRPTDTLILDNSVLVQNGSSLTTQLGGTPDSPESRFTPTNIVETYVPKAAVVEGNQVQVILGTTVNIFDHVRTDIATLSLPDLELLSITTVNRQAAIAYGTALLEQGGFVYIYGVEEINRGQEKFMHVARTTLGNLLGPWEYFDGSGWSPNPDASARVLGEVASEYSVVEHQGTLLLVSHALSFSEQINLYRATNPQGPWTHPVVVFCTPETGDNMITANALAHPDLGLTGDDLLISYMVTPFFAPDLAFANADHFRPRFIRVPLDEVLSR